MKKVLWIVIILFAAMQSQAQFTKATLQATGLTCAMCSNAVNKALKAVSFVESVRSDIKNSAFSIVFRKDAVVDIDGLKNAVEDAGFSVGSLKLTGVFNGTKVDNDQHVEIANTNFHFLDIKQQTLEGENTITVVDKDFVTAKQFKKIGSLTKLPCLQSGKAESCCTRDGVQAGARVYHVTI